MSFRTAKYNSFGSADESVSKVGDCSTASTTQQTLAGLGLSNVCRMDGWFIIFPFFTFLCAFVACLAVGADIPTAKKFFCPDTNCWFMGENKPWLWFYQHGCTPPIVLGVCGIVASVFSYFFAPLQRIRELALFLAFTAVLGPGVLVNGLLKPYVGRPRPHEVTIFGGEKQFAYMGSNTSEYTCKSFPSGHASMGFYFMTPALYFYRRRPKLALAILLAGGTYGALVGFARISQGAHYLTDVVGAALCVYTTGICVLGSLALLGRNQARIECAEMASDTMIQFPLAERVEAADGEMAA